MGVCVKLEKGDIYGFVNNRSFIYNNRYFFERRKV
jgi:hypothetical protein